MINDFILDVCDELEIPVPKISYDTSVFFSSTMMAMCYDDTIYIKPSKPNPDLLFSIAHELRHMWQLKNNESFYFRNYKNVTQLDAEHYNLQIAEVDANAFAAIIMEDWFNLSPQFYGLSDKVVRAIKKRMSII